MLIHYDLRVGIVFLFRFLLGGKLLQGSICTNTTSLLRFGNLVKISAFNPEFGIDEGRTFKSSSIRLDQTEVTFIILEICGGNWKTATTDKK